MKKAIIAGAGIGGIATAIRLAAKGYDTLVIEASDKPGGKLNEFHLGPYRFDFGPSLFTLPVLVQELFDLAGKDIHSYFNYRKMDIACQYFWNDGSRILAWSDPDRLSREVEKVLGTDPQQLRKYLKRQKTLYRLTSPVFLERSLHRISSYLSFSVLKAALYTGRMDIFRTMDSANNKRLGNPKLVQIFNRMATYNGSDPFRAPGILNIISSLEHGDGVFFPEGGMYSITLSLVKLAEELGVKFRYNEKVSEILTEKDRVRGVRTSKGIYNSGVVVYNGDIYYAYRDLLPSARKPLRILSRERSGSALVFYWGVNKAFPGLQLHNIFFSSDYREEFREMFINRNICNDPTIYLHISSVAEKDDAPPGCQSWFVLVNAPADFGQDWDEILIRTRKNVLQKLSRLLGEEIAGCIEEEFVLNPGIIEEKTASYKGSLYGTSSNSRFSAFLRHPNFSRQYKGLFFVGGSVHPGGGIPLCLHSAKIVSGMVSG